MALGAAWRLLRYGLCFPFWGDEAYLNFSILHRGYRELLAPLEYTQVAPLLFLWIQRTAYNLFGGGEYALRAFPLLAGLAALALFCHLAWRELEPRRAALAIGLFSGTYALVRHTCESKPYAADLLAATLLVWLGLRWLRSPRAPASALAASLAVIPLVWLSYPAVFVAGGISLTLLAINLRTPHWRAWLGWSLYNAALVTSFLLFFFLFAAPHSARATGSWLAGYWRQAFPPLHSPGAFLWWLLTTHTGAMMAYPIGGRNFGSSLTTLLCLAGVFGLARQRRLDLLLLCLAPTLPTFIAGVLHRYPYGGSVRVAIHFAPAICLLAGVGAGVLIERVATPRRRALVGGAAGVVLLALPILGAARDMLQPYKSPEDAAMRRAMSAVAGLARPGGSIAIYNSPEGTEGPPDGPVFHQSLRYYLELYTGLVPRWRTEGGLRPDVSLLLVYRGPEYGPSRMRVERVAAQAGVKLVSETTYELSQRSAARLIVYRCAPAP